MQPCMWRAGYPWELLIAGRTGDERGGNSPDGVNVLPPSITVGGHMIHAVGLAWAERLQGSDRVALTSFGDGATSEGDFHEAMNFAAVFETPTVFFCQNNQFAISYPRSEQTRSASIAEKADGYGMTGVEVDGNDVAAVLVSVREAVESARRGGGPALIEAVTYRLGPHTTADDPGRYRDEAEAERWREKDPLSRIQILLEKARGWTPEWQEELEQGASAVIEEAVAKAEAYPQPTMDEMFARMYSEPTGPLPRPTRRGGHMSTLTLAQSLNSALDTALESDERVVLLGEDIGRTGGVFRITDGLREKYGAVSGLRHPGRRVGHRWRRIRDGDRRDATRRRDPVPRVSPIRPTTRSSTTWPGSVIGRPIGSPRHWSFASPSGVGSALPSIIRSRRRRSTPTSRA